MNIPTDEASVQRSGMVILRHLGVQCWRRNVGALPWTDKTGKKRLVRFEVPGDADVWGVQTVQPNRGRHWEIEFKAPGHKPTPAQLDWLWYHHKLGSVAFWCDNTETLKTVAVKVLLGWVIIWCEDGTFDLAPPQPSALLSQADEWNLPRFRPTEPLDD